MKKLSTLKKVAAVAAIILGLWLLAIISEALGAKQPYTVTKGDSFAVAGSLGFIIYRLESDRKELQEKLDKIIESKS